MGRIDKITAILLPLLIVAQGVQATNYYVSTTGSNGNTGLSAVAAWRNVAYAAGQPLLPGDNIYIEPGLYAAENVLLNSSGSPGNPITIRVDPANPGGVTVTPNSVVGLPAFQQNASNLSYVTIMGLVVSGVRQAAAFDFGNGAAGANNIQILNNLIQNVVGGNSFAIRFYTFNGCGCAVNNIVISGNTVQNVLTDGSGNPNQIIALGGNVSNSQVMGNVIDNVDSQAIDILGGYSWLNGSPTNVLVQQNIISNVRTPNSGGFGTAIFLDGVANSTVNANWVSGTQGWGIEVSASGDVGTSTANNNLVSNNVVYNSLRAGINVGGWNSGYPGQVANSNRIYNNTLYNNNTSFSSGEIILERGSNNDFQNNIVYAGTPNVMLSYANSVGSGNTGNTFDYNDWYSASVASASWQWFASSYSGLANWKAGSAQDTNAIATDPLFVNAAGANFNLLCGSPAIDTGRTLALVPKDFNNTYSRPIGVAYDRGAYEISCATPTPTITPTATQTRTPTITPSASPTVTMTRTTTATPTWTQTATQSVTPSATPSQTQTRTETMTPTWTRSSTPSATPSSSPSASPSATGSASLTASPSSTLTATQSVTASASPSLTPSATTSATPSATQTPTPSRTQTMTPSWTPTPTQSASVTASPSATLTPTQSVTASGTPSATPSPTATLTATQSVTASGTPSASPTSTGTSSSTLTATATPSPSVTLTPSASASATLTATLTPTYSDSPSPSATGTFSATRTETETATASPSPTPSATPTASFTDSPSPSPSPSVTPTPQAMPNLVIIRVYNSAGELVRKLFDGPGTELSNLALSGKAMIPGSLGLTLSFSGTAGGQSGLFWKGDNDNGQLIDGGTYSIKVETKDPFGSTSAWIQQISVIPAAKKVALNIYNSAGELVAVLDPIAAGAVSPTQLKLAPGAAGFVVVDSNGAEIPVAFNGDGLSPGSYVAQLVNLDLGASKIIMSKGFVLLSAPKAANFKPLAVPNPLSPGDRLQIFYNPRPAGQSVSLRLYNAPGELIGQGLDSSGAGSIKLGAQAWAAGLYFAVLELREGRSLLSRQIIKVAIRK